MRIKLKVIIKRIFQYICAVTVITERYIVGNVCIILLINKFESFQLHIFQSLQNLLADNSIVR